MHNQREPAHNPKGSTMTHDPNLRAGDWHEDTYSNPGTPSRRWLIGSAVVVAVIAAAIGYGAWATNNTADPTTAEVAWLDELTDEGIRYGSQAQGVEMARAACEVWETDGPEAAGGILDLFDDTLGYDLPDAAHMAMTVIEAC